MNTMITAPSTAKRNLHLASRVSRAIFAGCLLLGASLLGCAGAPSDERVYDVASGELAPAPTEQGAEVKAGTRVVPVSLRQDVSRRSAEYTVTTVRGKRFKTTVSHRVQRDGADEIITAQDLDSGSTVTWSFGADAASFQAEDGRTALITGDDDAETLTLHAPGGSTTLSFAGVVEGSEQEQSLMSLASLAILGNAPFTQDQVEALAAAVTAGDEDLGAGSMSWGWLKKASKSLAKGITKDYSSAATSYICGVVGDAAIDLVFATAVELPPVAVGAAVVTAIAVGCEVGQVYACK